MGDNIQRSRGRGQGYKFDRGGTPAEFGPFIGAVKNNIDAVRSGRLQVYIEQFGGDNPDDQSLWRTVSYCPPFYGTVPQSGTNQGTGTFVGNQQSYGMWFTPPDIDTLVICFFIGGDPDQGFYLGCIPDTGISHMIPAIGASKNFDLQNSEQKSYLADAKQLPVTEINNDNTAITDDPKFYNKSKPVHSVVTAAMLQQGLINDPDRGPITSSSQRESPSSTYGISTPGRPVYQGGLSDADIKAKLDGGNVKPQDITVIARKGGHSIVMDDGDLAGNDNLVRIRTSKGHQITMSDNGDFFYIVHANGQTWIELGSEGTVDVYATNSVNIRTEGTLNLHSDQDINMYAGGNLNLKGKSVKVNSSAELELAAVSTLSVYSQGELGVTSDGSISVKGQSTAIDGGSSLNLKGSTINLNGSGGSAAGPKPKIVADVQLPGTAFVEGKGWEVKEGAITSIVTRAPTHEPYPYHNKGVKTTVDLSQPSNEGSSSASPVAAASPVPAPSTAAVAQLDTQPVTQAVTPANVLTQTPATASIGPLTQPQVTGMMSSAALSTGQPFNSYSGAAGVGQFGFSPLQLEQSGLLKPGTVAQFGAGLSIAGTVLNNPAVWTGRFNVNNIGGLLASANLQTRIQQGLMQTGLKQLQISGVLKGTETALQAAALVQSAAKFGPAAVVSWVGGQAGAALTAKINVISKNAQASVSLVANAFGLSLGGVGAVITGSINTVNRTGINAAVTAIIGNPKVSPFVFRPVQNPGYF